MGGGFLQQHADCCVVVSKLGVNVIDGMHPCQAAYDLIEIYWPIHQGKKWCWLLLSLPLITHDAVHMNTSVDNWSGD